MRRHQVSILAVLLVFALLLTACPAAAPAPAAEDAATAAPAEEAAASEASVESSDDVVEIEYWQYFFDARVQAMDQLIELFEAENPGIKVIHNSDIPYDDFRDKIATSVPAGVGPDVATLFYGWQVAWIDAGYIVPLPEEYFPTDMVNNEFSPMVQASFFDGKLYSLPTAVRTLALFYNKDLMEAAGLDPNSPPTTLTELEEQAVQCTKKDADGNYEIEGFVVEMDGQAHHWFREVLLRQFGQDPYSADDTQVLWNASDAGYAAWQELLKFETELQTGDNDLFDGATQAFLNGQACFHIDGSFRLGSIASNAPDLNFGVVELPEHNGVKSTFGSYWTHGITTKAAADPARLDASIKFLQFITSPEAGALWVQIVGELPAQLEAANNPDLVADEKLGAFAAGLPYAHATFFVNEADNRQALIDAYDMVLLGGEDPKVALDIAVETVQEMLDEFWAGR
ncbi:MAG TPA: extracellular solute-binding protein [Caldilineaceae bacterium]|nr:extracellular solute-binding protein [Caldilineaceae bacterium]